MINLIVWLIIQINMKFIYLIYISKPFVSKQIHISVHLSNKYNIYMYMFKKNKTILVNKLKSSYQIE